MKALRHAACCVLAALSFLAAPAHATSFSVDQSDIYYIKAESGWGIQLVQRGSVIFATLFVYGAANTPTFYVATLNSTDGVTWTGDLLSTTGTYFAPPWNPADFHFAQVGTMTWSPQSIATGTLTYSVTGTVVVKQVTRQSLALDDYNGTYLGGIHFAATGCTNPADNTPPSEAPLATITIAQNGQQVTITISIVGIAITITGTLSQDGQFGSMTGTYSAPGGEVGNASITQMNVQTNALSASFSLQSTNFGCLETGYVAGIRSRT